MRGGTSKGIFLMKKDLPEDPAERDRIILSIFGSPDIRQIDGLGGADLLTSKLALIAPPTRDDADVDYTFAQVGLDQSTVNMKGNCGNIAAAVGPFAINNGLVEVREPVTTVRIHLTNSHSLLVAEVPVKAGRAAVEGECRIAGVPGSGARITLDWKDGQGAFTGKLLPTGHVKDFITIHGKEYALSIFDVGNPLIFIKAEDLGVDGTETPQQLKSNTELMALLEELRGRAAAAIGMVTTWERAAVESAYVPFIAMVCPPKSHTTFDGVDVKADAVDIVSRLAFMQQIHKSYPVTSTVTMAIAAKIPGTVVHDVVRKEATSRVRLAIGHPSGIIPAESIVEIKDGTIHIKKAAMYRTARLIMDGYVYVKNSVINQ